MSAEKEVVPVVCPGCGTAFVCGVSAGLTSCWCMEKPIGLPVPEGDGRCYCPACLEKRVSASAKVTVPEA